MSTNNLTQKQYDGMLIDEYEMLKHIRKIAVTENYKFVSSMEIAREIKEGSRGVSGIGAKGKSRIIG